MSKAEELAQQFHETYERLAPQYNYQTRKASAVPWSDVPENNKRLMIAVCTEILEKTPTKASPDMLEQVEVTITNMKYNLRILMAEYEEKWLREHLTNLVKTCLWLAADKHEVHTDG